MLPAARHAHCLGIALSTVFAVLAPVHALASRPATNVAVARVRVLAEIGGGHSVSGGGRGRVQLVTRREAPPRPPTTHATRASEGGCLLVQTHDGSRRMPQSRTTCRLAVSSSLRVVCLVGRLHEGHVAGSAALFYDAHAPPQPATDVAGLLA